MLKHFSFYSQVIACGLFYTGILLVLIPLAGNELLFTGNSRACECATTILRHCTHSSAFLPSFGLNINDWLPVNISNAFGIFLAPRDTLTDRI